MARMVLERFPAGGPRGSWPAEEFAQARRNEGLAAEVVMDIEADAFLVVMRQPRPEPRTPAPRAAGSRVEAAVH
ncbi:hypothetical protein [Streptomyces ficellus]|uniref:Uncharacterized protein n=1 Tax=Streptomyces ficellus TaxID=1977088 RepID=A0A6I6FE06_9ACTN|nr:hypothetical protein [Streptomyces ficellus]QGV81920.1 hypothetical protein EIZ62_29405 [Streptomyces ficellus]